MRTIGFALFAMLLVLPVQADTYGPLRSTTDGKVVGMILVAGNDGDIYVRASMSTIKKDRVYTAWIFCRDDLGRVGPPDRLDGNIGSPTLEGIVDPESLCADAEGIAVEANAVEIVVINHGKPVDSEFDGMEGSVIQVTTNNVTDPFCNGTTQPPEPTRVCTVLATGIAPLP